MTLSNELNNIWQTKDHTPIPLYAIMIPTIPDMITAIKDIFDCVLKSTATISLTLLTATNEFIIKFKE